MWALLGASRGVKRCRTHNYLHAASAVGAQIASSSATPLSAIGAHAAAAAPTARPLSTAAAASDAADPFGSPPRLPQRRVVVTGIGIVSPVGVGAATSWDTLVAGRTGTRRLREEDLPEVRTSSGVVAVVQ